MKKNYEVAIGFGLASSHMHSNNCVFFDIGARPDLLREDLIKTRSAVLDTPLLQPTTKTCDQLEGQSRRYNLVPRWYWR